MICNIYIYISIRKFYKKTNANFCQLLLLLQTGHKTARKAHCRKLGYHQNWVTYGLMQYAVQVTDTKGYLYVPGLCKHQHLGLMAAASRGIDIVNERQKRADEILKNRTYYFDERFHQIEVISGSGDVSLVKIDAKAFSCSCMAFSHGIKCICMLVASSVAPTLNEVEAPEVSDNTGTAPVDLDDVIRGKVDEISSFVNSDKLTSLNANQKDKVLASVTSLHSMLYMAKFRKVTRKRRQTPLHPYRQSKKPKANEHSYSITKRSKSRGQTRKDDGSFKKFGRKKQGVRKPFQ